MSDKHNDGGPAHPVVGTVGPIGKIEATGISIRDYFAGQALPSAMNGQLWATTDEASVANLAYRIADAMLKERSK